jgi:hypothetical protein
MSTQAASSRPRASAAARPRRSSTTPEPATDVRPPRELLTWLRVQADNSRRHVAALRPFTRVEFGSGPEAPTEGHVQALGAILHEVCHNLHNDLGLARAVPLEIGRRLLDAGLPPEVARIWVRWNRETFADLAGLLLGGPAVVSSLMDVIGRSPQFVTRYVPGAPHPTPFLRVLVSVELLHRMGFDQDARLFRQIWLRSYPRVPAGAIPAPVLRSFPDASRTVIEAICGTPFRSLGGKTLAQTLRFEPKEQQMIEEAARRLAQGNDPGVVPERFLIGAARFALDRRLATPEVLTANFYRELARR